MNKVSVVFLKGYGCKRTESGIKIRSFLDVISIGFVLGEHGIRSIYIAHVRTMM